MNFRQAVNFSNLQRGYAARTIVAATQTIISSTLLRQACRIDTDITDHDALLTLYAKAAEVMVENEAEITLRKQTREFWIESLPSPLPSGLIQLRIETPPVTAINSVKYYDSAGVQQTLSASAYSAVLDGNPPLVCIDYYQLPVGLALPYSSLAFRKQDEWRVNYTCGIVGVDATPTSGLGDGASTLPELAQLAIMELVAFWFRHAEAFLVVPPTGPYPQIINSLKWRY